MYDSIFGNLYERGVGAPGERHGFQVVGLATARDRWACSAFALVTRCRLSLYLGSSRYGVFLSGLFASI